MQWLRCRHDGQDHFARVEGAQARLVTGTPFGAHQDTGTVLALDALEWLPPVQPSKVVALWKNYRALAAKQQQEIPAEPLYALRAPSSLVGHRAPMARPRGYDGPLFFEGELAVVIGRTAAGLTPAQAADHILGYTLVNDVTAGEIIGRDASFAQWTRAKAADGTGPLGPVIATDFDPRGAVLLTRVNGRERQNYPLDDMIFGPHELVARLSNDMTLLPGDVILCGTSVGSLPMRPDSEVEVEVAGIGVLSNRLA